MKIAIIANEASGDYFGSTLIPQLKSIYPTAEYSGIGGPLMIQNGFNSWYEMIALMGYLEVIKSLPKLIKLRKNVLQRIIEYKPDVFIGIDAPDFTLWIEKQLKSIGIKTIHYISPSLWGWRYNRIYKIKYTTDIMLCIFPFEPEIYHKHKIPAYFIGNPIANSIELDINTSNYRNQMFLPLTETIITVLIGSREEEIHNLAELFIKSCIIVSEKQRALFIFACANENTKLLTQNYLISLAVQFQYMLIVNNTQNAIKVADIVLTKSGTITLEVALCKKAMVVCYKLNLFTALLVFNKIKSKYISQPNIIMNKLIVPELLQADAYPENIANHLIDIHNDKQAQATMIREFYILHEYLKQNVTKLSDINLI